MTENMAARGEGLAGLVAQPARRELYSALVSELRGTILISSPTWRCPTNEEAHHMANAAIRIVEHFVQWVEALMKVEGERAIFALEAAAPAGTGQWKVELLSGKGNWSDAVSPHFDTWEAAQGRANELAAGSGLGVKFRVVRAALATPSPQAPTCTCKRVLDCPVHGEQSRVFSTTSAREQSSATASNKPSAAETVTWPPIPKYLLEPIVFRDANLGIAMVAFYRGEQWVLKVNKETWLTIRKVTAEDPLFIMETLNEPPAATQEQPAGSGASEQLLQDFNARFGFGIFVVTGEHQRTAFFSKEKAEQYLAQQDPERFRIVVYPKPDPGSPRKVGEDGPVTEQLSKARASALAQFTDYFVRNYPGPDTIIFKPTWHAPRIFSAAYGAILDALRSSSVPVGEQKD